MRQESSHEFQFSLGHAAETDTRRYAGKCVGLRKSALGLCFVEGRLKRTVWGFERPCLEC